MTAFDLAFYNARQGAKQVLRSIVLMTHNTFAMLGILLTFLLLAALTYPDLRSNAEHGLVEWLQARKADALGLTAVETEAIDRATATDPKDLPKGQANLADWISRKYRVAPEPISALVAEAFEAGKQIKLEPTLILAVMAVESGFNPFAQSAVGAQGLMQVMTTVHSDKFNAFGGRFSTFDPVTNLRVGIRVLQDCIVRGGSIEGGLRCYVGASGPDDGGYGSKVLAEQKRLQLVYGGQRVPVSQQPPASPSLPSASHPATESDDTRPALVNKESLASARPEQLALASLVRSPAKADKLEQPGR
jgi:hypothetical protein